MPGLRVPGFGLPRRARSVSAGRNPASVLPAPVGAIRSADLPASASASNSSWWARGCQPFEANQSRKGRGRSITPVDGAGVRVAMLTAHKLERVPIGLKQFDERWFSQPARRRPQSDAGASVEDFDAAGAEISLKPEVMQLSKLMNPKSPELGPLHSEQRREKSDGSRPASFSRSLSLHKIPAFKRFNLTGTRSRTAAPRRQVKMFTFSSGLPFPPANSWLSLPHAFRRPAAPDPERALLPARRFLHRSGAAGGARAHHPWPCRPCARRAMAHVLATPETLDIMAISLRHPDHRRRSTQAVGLWRGRSRWMV